MKSSTLDKPEPPTEGKPEPSDFGITDEDLRRRWGPQWDIVTMLFSILVTGSVFSVVIMIVSLASPGFAVILAIAVAIGLLKVNINGFSENLTEEKLKAAKRYDEAEKEYKELWRSYKERLEAYERTRADWWFSLSGREFEIKFADLLETRGYTTQVTQATGDGGVDICAQKDGLKIIIECKAWQDKVGVTILRQLNGVRAIDEVAWVVGLSGFSQPAIDFAREKSIQLYDYNDIARWVEEGKDDSEHSNKDPKREIEVSLSRALTRPDGIEIPVLSEMVSRSLTNIEASNKLSTLHRIGDHELHSPDYRLVCVWAEELNQGVERTVDSLLGWGAEISEGRFVSLRLKDPLNSIPLIGGLELRKLDCRYNNLTELDLTPVPNLEELYCLRNNLTELNLTPVPNLKKLNCWGNNLAKLDLTPVPNLEELHCFENNLTELDLTPVPNLKKLDCSENHLTGLDLTPVPNLKRLDCCVNELTELNLTPVPKLKLLHCIENNLTELDLTPVPNLKRLDCSENHLTGLDLTPVPNLKELEFCNNNLTELNLTPVPNLKKLDCEDNNLTELDLTPVPKLKELEFCNNKLTELDLTPVPKLRELDCKYNSLTGLDLTPVPNLKRLECSENNLTELDLTPVPKLDASSTEL